MTPLNKPKLQVSFTVNILKIPDLSVTNIVSLNHLIFIEYNGLVKVCKGLNYLLFSLKNQFLNIQLPLN